MVTTRRRLLALGLAGLVLASVVPLGAAALPDEQTTTVDSCRTIDEPGTYRLTSDLETDAQTCLTVTASDVTIDGDGHAIDTAEPPRPASFDLITGTGVEVDSDRTLANVTVRNVTGHGWGTLVSMTNVTHGTVVDVATPRPDAATHVGYAVTLDGVRDVTLRDSDIEATTLGAPIRIAESRDVAVRNTTVAHVDYRSIVGHAKGVTVRNTTDVTFANDTFADLSIFTSWGVDVQDSVENARLVNNTVTDAGVRSDATNTTVVDNAFRDGGGDVYGDDARVANNTVVSGALTVGGDGATVTANHLTAASRLTVENDAPDGPVRADVVGNTFTNGSGVAVAAANVRVRENTITGASDDVPGVTVHSGRNVTVAHNAITDSETAVRLHSSAIVTANALTNDSVGVRIAADAGVCGDPARVELHRNDLSNATDYGVENDAATTVNATRNDWGGAPSSPDDADAPISDPVTGEPADGTGSAVSEGANAGVSNVRFDPWLDAPATETTTRNATA